MNYNLDSEYHGMSEVYGSFFGKLSAQSFYFCFLFKFEEAKCNK